MPDRFPGFRIWGWGRRVIGRRPAASAIALTVLIVLASASAASATGPRSGSGLLVTFAARSCPNYTDITANRARNDIQESLRDLGADSPYGPGQMMDPVVEQEHQPNCKPLPNWTFTLGTGYQTRAVHGPWGALSIVTGAYPGAITTQASTPLLDAQGQPTGQSIAGATTVELTEAQAAQAARGYSLWAQGGTTADPILNQQFPGQFGFGALRCAIDDLNGDNVEWIGYPSGVRHVFCFAYYVEPPPTSGTIVIRKQVSAPAGMSEIFPFQGSVSFNEGGRFSLAAGAGQSAQQTFYRAETSPGEAPWTAQELVPPNWKLTGLQCTSSSGHSTTSTNLASASVAITLAAGDTVTCTYSDEFVPPKGGLEIRKLTAGGTGRFDFEVKPAAGGDTVTAAAQTRQEGEAVDADPSPLSLEPGSYELTETRPAPTTAGRWEPEGVQCNGHDEPAGEPVHVVIVSGQSTTCTFANLLVPLGSIGIAKVTRGAVATTGFVISPTSGPPFELHQSATTTREGVLQVATGDPAEGLELGRYLVQETTPEPAGSGHWELTSVQCAGHELPFADGRATVELTASEPSPECIFTNTHERGPAPTPAATGSAAAQVDPPAALTVEKVAARPRYALGEPVRFELTVRNHSSATAGEVVLNDEPLAAATLASARPSQGSCAHSLPVTCLLGAIAPGHSATVAIVMVPHAQGTFVNEAVLGTSSLDPSSSGLTARAQVLVGGQSVSGFSVGRAFEPAFTG